MATPIKLLHNQKCDTWHPILYRDSPLPGNPGDLLRFKSIGHHTTGFKTRSEAISEVNSPDFKSKIDMTGSYPVYFTSPDVEWDGEDIPADVLLLSPSDLSPANHLAS